MFYILVSIGIVSIIIGIIKYEPYNNNNVDEGELESLLAIELENLRFRIENLEKEFYENKTTSFHEIASSTYKEILEEDEDLSFSSLENYKKVLQFEKENYSIEEISEKLHMKKGEVLLLKNLYKNYQD